MTSENVLSAGLPLFNNLHFWLKLIYMLQFLYPNLWFRLPILPLLLLILLESEAVVRCCSARKLFLQISQNSQENTKKQIRRHICFLVNSAKILITSFLKNPSGGCFSINIRSVYYPTMTFCIFKNDVIHIFWLFFYGLICRLGTRVSSIFQVLSQKPIFIPIEHLRWSFFCENI